MIALVKVYKDKRVVDQYNIDLPIRCLWSRSLFRVYQWMELKRAEWRQASSKDIKIKMFVPRKKLSVQILNRNFQTME